MLKNKTIFYKKLMISYNIIIFSFIIGLNFILFKNFENKNIKYNMEINNNMIKRVEEKLNLAENSIGNFINTIYSDSNLTKDVMYFLNNNLNEYLKNKLDSFYNNNNSYYNGIENLIKNTFNSNSLIETIEIASYKTNTSYLFNRYDNIKVENIIDENIDKEQTAAGIIYYRTIYDPFSLNPEGAVKFKIDESKIDSILKNYEENQRTMILQKNGLILYDSNEKNKKLEIQDINRVEELFYFQNDNKKNTNLIELKNDLLLVGMVEDTNIFLQYKEYIYIFIINIIFFIGAEFFIFKRLEKLNDRLNTILETMQSININDKLKRIPESVQNEKDEISIICKNFNKMCGDLEEYIEKYYISQINEKNAEMKLLQSHINPHFLYNTLESIRMKAITNNDKEVSKMIYLLAHLFRSQLKEKDLITIKSELEYCNKFLEIYKFRYSGKIEYIVECEEPLLEQEIIKFILQPLLENYFIHGARLQDNNNKISIRIKRILNYTNIIIEDNGKGIDKEKLESLQNKIKNKENDIQMVGLLNVNQRIKIKYGDKYGVFIESEKDKGTTIVIKLPYVEKETPYV